MIETETCTTIRKKIKDEKAMILQCHGVPGSGKSQIVRKMAEEFPFKKSSSSETEILVKWHIQCKDSGHDVQQELKLLAERLLKSSHKKVTQERYQNVVDNLEMHQAGDLVNILVEINVPVVIIIEDPPPDDREKLLQSLCRRLKCLANTVSSKFHVYISSRQSNVLSKHEICSVQVKGFSEKEAITYLQNGGLNDEEKNAAHVIYKRFGGLPLGLQVAKGYCKKVRIPYMDYIDLVQDVEYDIINEERKETVKEYGDSAEHVFQALVMPFVPNDNDDTTAVLPWKIICCISYLHYDRIPRSVLEQCCHILREGKVKKPLIKNRVEVGALISKLMEHNMCTETDEHEITFHEVVLNAFRLNKHSVLKDKFKPLEKAIEIMSGLVSKDMRKKGHSIKMYKLRRHLQSLLEHIEKDEHIFKSSKDALLLNALTSHLCETAAAIMLNESPLFWKQADLHFKKSLHHIWPEMSKYTQTGLQKCTKNKDEIAQDILKHSESKASQLPTDFTVKYASKLEFCFEQDELDFLESRSSCRESFADVKKSLKDKGCTEIMVRKLQRCELFLSDDKYRPIFYAERFAFILHSWSRLVLYGDSEEVKEVGEKCILMSDLSNKVSVACKKLHNVSLLAEPLSKTGGWIPILLKLKRSSEELKDALKACKDAMQNHEVDDMYENGMLKEVYGPSHKNIRIQLLRYIVRINARLHKGATPEFVAEADEHCFELIELSIKNARELSSCLMCLVYCAKYFGAKGDFVKALRCFDKYFKLEPECNPRFNVRSWATFNYVRAVNAHENCPFEHKQKASEKCNEVLQSKDVMTRSLKRGLNGYMKNLKAKYAADL